MTARIAARPGSATSGTATESVAADARERPFESAVREHYAPLIRRLVLVLGNAADAEDVAQEAWLRAYRAWSRFDGRDVRAWLYTIALRLAFNERRRQRRFPVLPGRPPQEEPVGPAWHDDVDPDLAAALGRLDPRTRAVLLAHVLDGYTQREIAGMLGVPEGTVASWLSRGRARLREALAAP